MPLARWCGVVIVITAAAATLSAHQTGVPGTIRTIYASVTNEAGRPVLGLTASDFEVRENGILRPLEVQPASEPLRVALIVSQGGWNDRLIAAARAFCESFEGNGDVSVISVMGEAETLSGFSDRVGDCLAALNRLEIKQNVPARTNPELVDTILKTSRTIAREGWRPAIIVLRAGAEHPTPLYGDRLRRPIRTSGAVVYVASTPGAADQLTMRFGLAMSTIIDTAIERGGRHVVLGREPAVMRQVAAELVTSYRIRYDVAPGTGPDARLSVRSTRPGITVRAPSRVAH